MSSIEFSILAETSLGSHVRVVGSPEALGCWEPRRGLELQTGPGQYPRWSASTRIAFGGRAEYKFILFKPDGSAVWEEGDNRVLIPGTSGPAEVPTPTFRKEGVCPSSMQNSPPRLVASSSAPTLAPAPQVPPATEVAVSQPPAVAPALVQQPGQPGENDGEDLLFEAVCMNTAPGDVLRAVGSLSSLGNWDPQRGLRLTTSPTSFPRWSGKAALPARCSALEWKLVICCANGEVQWEPGDNRHTSLKPHWDGSWLVRVHFGGSCSAPEPCTSGQTTRSRSLPGTPLTGTAESGTSSRLESGASSRMPRNVTEDLTYLSKPSSWKVTAPVVSAVPVEPVASADEPSQPVNDEPIEAPARQWARSSSLSHFGALLGNDGPPSIPLGAGRSRARNVGNSMEEQAITFTLNGVDQARAAASKVEAVFETDGLKRMLRLEQPEGDATQARWTLSLGDSGLPPGLHLLHFLVEGKRCLSRDLPVFGELNGVIFSEPLRRYISARDERVPGNQHVPLSHSRTSDRLGGSPSIARSGNSFDDADVALPGQRQGNMPRPFSICGNLVALGDDEEESSGMDSKSAMASFSKEVFEGLYDGELRLRMDGYMLPEPAPLHRPQPLKLWSGAHLLKKKIGACEDAFFNEDHSLGVADGVGCMVQFASYGINAAAYAAELMVHAAKALVASSASGKKEPVEQRAVSALSEAEQGAQAYGASTITVVAMEGNTVGVANLGDSGFLHLRKGHRGMQVLRRSEEQQHSWNCPYQLTRLPPALISRFPKLCLDSASDCEQYSFSVREGDLILVFTDGLRDNLHEREILHIVDCALAPAFGELCGLREQCTAPDRVARSLALAAQERSLDPSAKVPFVEYSRKHGYECQGGKQDDITVVAAWVVPEDQPSMDCAVAALAEPRAEPKAEPQVEVPAPAPEQQKTPSVSGDEEGGMEELIAKVENISQWLKGSDDQPQPAEDVPATKAEPTKEVVEEIPAAPIEANTSNGVLCSKDEVNEADETNGKNCNNQNKVPDEVITTPRRPTPPRASTPTQANGTGESPVAQVTRPATQPTYETPHRRGAFEQPSHAAGNAPTSGHRRQQPCRAPMSASTKNGQGGSSKTWQAVART